MEFTRMLSGFTSRWTKPLAFMYASPVAAPLKILRLCSLMKAKSFAWRRRRRLPDGKNSMMKCDVAFKAPPFQHLDHAERLRVARRAGVAVADGDADHLRVAAQEHVRRRRVERRAEVLLHLPAADQLLNVLFSREPRLARRQREV